MVQTDDRVSGSTKWTQSMEVDQRVLGGRVPWTRPRQCWRTRSQMVRCVILSKYNAINLKFNDFIDRKFLFYFTVNSWCNEAQCPSLLTVISDHAIVQELLLLPSCVAVICAFKVQGFFICHIINYTGYNQK